MAKVRIGISGWRYPPWRGVFYPENLRQKEELAFAARQFKTIEINGTFYNLQKPAYFRRWAAETPRGFVFSVKAPRYITHIRRLRDIATPLANFLASGPLALGPKLGPMLWQFPPTMRFDPAPFEDFLARLPHDTLAAARLARRHDSVVREVDYGDGIRRSLRHAVEIRHDSFRDGSFARMLRRHRVALVCADTVEWPRLMDLTGGFVYCRLHGSEKLYASGYTEDALDTWARRIRAWRRGSEPRDGCCRAAGRVWPGEMCSSTSTIR